MSSFKFYIKQQQMTKADEGVFITPLLATVAVVECAASPIVLMARACNYV